MTPARSGPARLEFGRSTRARSRRCRSRSPSSEVTRRPTNRSRALLHSEDRKSRVAVYAYLYANPVTARIVELVDAVAVEDTRFGAVLGCAGVASAGASRSCRLSMQPRGAGSSTSSRRSSQRATQPKSCAKCSDTRRPEPGQCPYHVRRRDGHEQSRARQPTDVEVLLPHPSARREPTRPGVGDRRVLGEWEQRMRADDVDGDGGDGIDHDRPGARRVEASGDACRHCGYRREWEPGAVRRRPHVQRSHHVSGGAAGRGGGRFRSGRPARTPRRRRGHGPARRSTSSGVNASSVAAASPRRWRAGSGARQSHPGRATGGLGAPRPSRSRRRGSARSRPGGARPPSTVRSAVRGRARHRRSTGIRCGGRRGKAGAARATRSAATPTARREPARRAPIVSGTIQPLRRGDGGALRGGRDRRAATAHAR